MLAKRSGGVDQDGVCGTPLAHYAHRQKLMEDSAGLRLFGYSQEEDGADRPRSTCRYEIIIRVSQVRVLPPLLSDKPLQ